MASASDQIRNESFYEIKEQGYRITMNNTLWTGLFLIICIYLYRMYFLFAHTYQ